MANLTADEFFGGVFFGCYVCGMRDDRGQVGGWVLSDEMVKQGVSCDELGERYLFPLNKHGYNIHFTPNGVKSGQGRNRKDNIEFINSWWIEVDIEGTKNIETEVDLDSRIREKDKVLNFIFDFCHEMLMPSLVVETRNGFHIYWFSKDGKTENFSLIQKCLAKYFYQFNVDESAMRINSMLRVPYFKYYKHGESGVVMPIDVFSSLKLYREEEMLTWLHLEHEEVRREFLRQQIELKPVFPIKMSKKYPTFKSVPIDKILIHLSGTSFVNFERITLKRTNENILSVLINGKSSPNFILTNANLILSNTDKKMRNIYDYLAFYGHDEATVTNILKTLEFL